MASQDERKRRSGGVGGGGGAMVSTHVRKLHSLADRHWESWPVASTTQSPSRS